MKTLDKYYLIYIEKSTRCSYLVVVRNRFITKEMTQNKYVTLYFMSILLTGSLFISKNNENIIREIKSIGKTGKEKCKIVNL